MSKKKTKQKKRRSFRKEIRARITSPKATEKKDE